MTVSAIDQNQISLVDTLVFINNGRYVWLPILPPRILYTIPYGW
jgi:hypothetical protein